MLLGQRSGVTGGKEQGLIEEMWEVTLGRALAVTVETFCLAGDAADSGLWVSDPCSPCPGSQSEHQTTQPSSLALAGVGSIGPA